MAPRTLDRPLPTRRDVRRMLDECGGDKLLHTAATLLPYTGVRTGELTALTIRDYDSNRGTLTTGTTRNPRTIAIARSACAALDGYLEGEDTEPGEPLLIGLRREWMSPLLRGAAKRAGADVGVHDLRRAAMAAVMRAGRSDREIRRYFGMAEAVSENDLVPLHEGWDRRVASDLEAAFTSGA